MPEQGAQWVADPAGVYFSDRFNVNPQVLEDWGAFDISVADLIMSGEIVDYVYDAQLKKLIEREWLEIAMQSSRRV